MTIDFTPQPATIESIEEGVVDHHLFRFRLGSTLPIRPGKFFEISLRGIGAFPVSTAAASGEPLLEACIRRTGRVTDALYRLEAGDEVGIRGPFGQGFPLEMFDDRDALLIAGGLGMAPLRGVLHGLLQRQPGPRRMILLYGSHDPTQLLFRQELDKLADQERIELRYAVDTADEGFWTKPTALCRLGLVGELLEGLPLDPPQTSIAACGPPALYSCMLEELAALGIPAERIFATLERRMKCGVGLCCHCHTAGKAICVDGPVFSLATLRTMPGAI